MIARILVLALALVAAGAAQTKVAIINTQKAVLDSAEIKKAQSDLEVKFKPRQDQLVKLQKDLQDLQAQLSSGKLDANAQQDVSLTGQRKQRELQRVTEDLQADVERERNEILQRMGARMQTIVKTLAEAKGLDVVVDSSNTIYYKPALDLTAEATAAYDKAYPVK